jgi:hypothetical protein
MVFNPYEILVNVDLIFIYVSLIVGYLYILFLRKNYSLRREFRDLSQIDILFSSLVLAGLFSFSSFTFLFIMLVLQPFLLINIIYYSMFSMIFLLIIGINKGFIIMGKELEKFKEKRFFTLVIMAFFPALVYTFVFSSLGGINFSGLFTFTFGLFFLSLLLWEAVYEYSKYIFDI